MDNENNTLETAQTSEMNREAENAKHEKKHRSSHHSSSHHSSSHHSSSHHSSSHHSSSHHSSSHHSSSSHSSGKSSHKKSSKRSRRINVKHYGKFRTFFAFLLFLSISATAIFAGARLTVLNHSRVSDIFTNAKYIDAMYHDVVDYSKDLCLKYSLPEECAKDAVSYKDIYEIQNAYTAGVFDMDEMYTESSYLEFIKDLNKEIVSTTKSTLKKNNISIYTGMSEKGAQKYADDITDFITKRVEFEYISDIQSTINVSTPVLNVAIVLFAILSVAFLLLTVSFNDKNYRSLRSVTYAIFGASQLNLLLVAAVGIVAIFKDFLVFPSYLCDSIMGYIYQCISTFLFEGVTLFLIGLMVAALVWRLKRNND